MKNVVQMPAPQPAWKQKANKFLLWLCEVVVIAFFFTQWGRLEGENFYLVGTILALYLHYRLRLYINKKPKK